MAGVMGFVGMFADPEKQAASPTMEVILIVHIPYIERIAYTVLPWR